MRIQKTKNNKKKAYLIITVFLAVIIIGIGTAYALKLSRDSKTEIQKPNTVNYKSPTDEQIKNGSSIKQNSVDNTNTSDTPVAPTPQPGSSMNRVDVLMTSANQNGNQFQLRFQIDADVDEGICSLKLSKDNVILNYSAEVQDNSKVATCKGFNIPIDENNLSPGTWNVAMGYASTTLSGSLNTKIDVK